MTKKVKLQVIFNTIVSVADRKEKSHYTLGALWKDAMQDRLKNWCVSPSFIGLKIERRRKLVLRKTRAKKVEKVGENAFGKGNSRWPSPEIHLS